MNVFSSLSLAVAIHPQFDPVAVHLGKLQLHWYGLMYLLAFASAYALAWYRATLYSKAGYSKAGRADWNTDMVSDLVFYGAMGVILGGRVGYVLFYQFSELLANPAYLFKVWEGGMSFHGGFIGVGLAMWLFARKYKKNVFNVLDFIIPCVPPGLLFGRLGNFINGELWGRVSNGGYNWLMAFPQAWQADQALIGSNPTLQSLAIDYNNYPLLPRHPSQLYQAFSEGLVLFLLCWWFSSKPRPRMAVTGLFVLGYGLARFTTEFFRQPDAGYELFMGWMSKGQLLSLPMVVVGLILLFLAYKTKVYDWGKTTV